MANQQVIDRLIAERKQDLTESAIDYALSLGEEQWKMSGHDAYALAEVAIQATVDALCQSDEDESYFDHEAIENAIKADFT